MPLKPMKPMKPKRPRLCVFCPVGPGRPLSELAGELVGRLSHSFEISLYGGRHEDEVMEWARSFPLRHATAYRADRQRQGDAARLFLLEDDAYTCEALIPALLRFGGAVYFLDSGFNRLYQTTTIYRGEPEALVEKMRLVHGRLGERVARAMVAGKGRDEWFDHFDLIAPLARAAALCWTASRRLQIRLHSLRRAAAIVPVPVGKLQPPAPDTTLLLFLDQGSDQELADFFSGLGEPSPWGRIEVVAPPWRHQAVRPVLASHAPEAVLSEGATVPPEACAALVDLRRAPRFQQHLARHRALMAGRLLAVRADADSAHIPEDAVLRAGSAGDLGRRLARSSREETARRCAAAAAYAQAELTYSRAADAIAYALLSHLNHLEAASRRWERFAARENRRWRARILRAAEGRLAAQGFTPAQVRRAAHDLWGHNT